MPQDRHTREKEKATMNMLTNNKARLLQRDNSVKNETTPLLVSRVSMLKPSPGSTDHPTSWSNLAGDWEQQRAAAATTRKSDSEISLVSLSQLHKNDDDDDEDEEKMSEYGATLLTPCHRLRHRLCRRRALVDLALVVVGIVGFLSLRYFMLLGPSSTSSSSSSGGSSRDPSNNSPSNNNNNNNNNKPSSIIIRAFSQLDPVQDLGLTNFQRPRSSRPPPNLESYVLKQQQQQQGVRDTIGTNASETLPTPTVAIPTNAWYQNLLSVDDNDMPNSIHRAYTIPYIVDAAGPIAGLRIHVSHILATQTVIQLNVIEEHGLVVGAAAAASAVSAHQQQRDDEILNTRFHVDNMTPLAITLGWVRFIGRCFYCIHY
jgi:hypothetical protein